MVKHPVAAAFTLLALLAPGGLPDAHAQTATATGAREITLALPHELRTGENAWLQVQVGPIARGQEINVTTASGQPLGTISPFAVRPGQDAGTYPLPLPAEAIRDGRVAVRLTISQAGGPPRAPTAQEVRGVKVQVGGGAR